MNNENEARVKVNRSDVSLLTIRVKQDAMRELSLIRSAIGIPRLGLSKQIDVDRLQKILRNARPMRIPCDDFIPFFLLTSPCFAVICDVVDDSPRALQALRV